MVAIVRWQMPVATHVQNIVTISLVQIFAISQLLCEICLVRGLPENHYLYCYSDERTDRPIELSNCKEKSCVRLTAVCKEECLRSISKCFFIVVGQTSVKTS